MNGRPLNDEEISRIEQFGWQIGDIPNLIATIRDRDNTIAKWKHANQSLHELGHRYLDKIDDLKEQNTLMLSALERIHRYGVEKPFDEHSEAIAFHHVQIISADTIAQVKALTVSKQEESTVSEVACEQTNKDSLNVARQNNPTHPNKHMSKLAAEVATDMQWREGEQK